MNFQFSFKDINIREMKRVKGGCQVIDKQTYLCCQSVSLGSDMGQGWVVGSGRSSSLMDGLISEQSRISFSLE